MFTRRLIHSCVAMVAAAAALAILANVGISADKIATKDSAARTDDTKRKVRGRLPAYYRQVINEEQREKIYAIQAKYRTESEKVAKAAKKATPEVRAKLAALRRKEVAEIESVLTAEQLATIERFRAADTAARKKANDAKKPSPK